MIHGIIQLAYLVATVLFIFSLHWMNTPATARNGGVRRRRRRWPSPSSATWAQPEVVHHGLDRPGDRRGVRRRRAAVPGAAHRGAAADRAVACLWRPGGRPGRHRQVLPLGVEGPENLTAFRMVAIIAEILLGFLTFTGSLMAAGKLQEVKWIPQRPVTYPLQNLINLGLLGRGRAGRHRR